MKTGSRSRGFTPNRDCPNRHAQFQSDHMPPFIQTAVTARIICGDFIFLEAIPNIIRICFNTDPDTFANIIGNRLSICCKTRNHLDHMRAVQNTAYCLGAHKLRDVINRARRKAQPLFRHLESAGISNGCRFNCGF